SFIADPAPVRITVVEVVPPRPAKLVDQLTRVLDLAEDLPPVELVPDLVDLAELAGSRPAGHYLFPCRAGGAGPGRPPGAGGGRARGGCLLPRRGACPQAVDPGGVRPVPRHPRLLLRWRRRHGGHVPPRPGRPASHRPARSRGDQVLPAGGPGQRRWQPRGRALGCHLRPGEGGPGAGPAGGPPGPAMNGAGPQGHSASPGASPPTPRPGTPRLPGTRVADSALYAHLWGTAEARGILGEEGRLAAWLEVIAALARAQAAAGLIPARAAALITEQLRPDRIDLGYAAEQTRLASHSMLGLIRALRAALPEDAAEYVYIGATVQDVTDTATALAVRGIGALAWRDLRRIEELLLEAAVTHRSTVMAGRTHGQPGSPVTFGWKAASWADEIRRHLDRLAQGAPRWLVGQLGGGTGSLVYYGGRGLAVR